MRDFSKGLKEPKTSNETIFTKIQNWWWGVKRYSWFERKIEFPYKDFKTGIKNLIKWLPIVWKDRDWDDAYILYVLKFKIKNTRDRILKNNIIVDEDQAEIKRDTTICIKLIDSFTEESYSMEYLDYIRTKMSFVPGEIIDWETKSSEKTYSMEVETLEDNLDSYFVKYPLDYRRTIKWFNKHERDFNLNDPDNRRFFALMMSKIRQDKANSLLWKIINDRIQRWWD